MHLADVVVFSVREIIIFIVAKIRSYRIAAFEADVFAHPELKAKVGTIANPDLLPP